MSKRKLILCLFLFSSLGLCADVLQKEVKDGYNCLSPDKRFLATFSGVIVIHDEIGAKTFEPLRVLQPIFLMAWAQDSKSLFYIESIAGGSSLSVFQFSDGKWLRRDVDPPGDNLDSYTVINLNLNSDPVSVTYVTSRKTDGERINERVTFDLRLKDLSISDVKRKKITPEEYDNIGK